MVYQAKQEQQFCSYGNSNRHNCVTFTLIVLLKKGIIYWTLMVNGLMDDFNGLKLTRHLFVRLYCEHDVTRRDCMYISPGCLMRR